MTWLMRILVGSTVGRIVAIALAAGLTLFGTIQYIRWDTERRMQERIDQLETEIQDYIDTRRRINEGADSIPDDPDAAREWLRDRQSK